MANYLKKLWRRLYGRNAQGAAEVEQIAVLQRAAARRRAEYAQEEQARLTEKAAESGATTQPMDMDCDTVHRSAEGLVEVANEADQDEDRDDWDAGAPGLHPKGAGIPDNFPNDKSDQKKGE